MARDGVQARWLWDDVLSGVVNPPTGHEATPQTVDHTSAGTITASGPDSLIYVLEVENSSSSNTNLNGIAGLPDTALLVIRAGATMTNNVVLAHNAGSSDDDIITDDGTDTSLTATGDSALLARDANGEWRVISANTTAT